MECLDEGFEDSMTAMMLPYHLRKYYRTSNQVERINKEMKKRSKAIGVFPNTDSLLRMMGSLLIELNDSLQLKKIIFKRETYEELINSEIPDKLRAIAEEQKQIRAA
jgi:transposase-like protein